MAKLAPVVVVGVFRGYRGPKWNTADGSKPTQNEFKEKPARLFRPITIDVDGAIRGDGSGGRRAIVKGGSLNCDRVTYSNELVLEAGGRYVYFLVPVALSNGKDSKDLLAIAAWPVGAGDLVETPMDGPVKLSDLASTMATTPFTGSP
jgi:hypothetical protein